MTPVLNSTGWGYNPDSANKKKIVIATTNFNSTFFFTGLQLITTHFSQHLYNCRIAISRTSLPILLRGLWVRVRPGSLLFTSGRLTNSENVVKDRDETMAKIATNALRV
jgi:hypothetical protein